MRVVVAGLGAMGSAVAFHLSRAGAEVVGLDPRQPPHAEGSSHGESRIIREAYFEDPLYVPLVRRAGVLWRSLELETERPLLRRTGVLAIGREDGALIMGTLRSAAAHGLEVERLEREAVHGRFPVFRVPEGCVAVLEPGAGVLDPEGCIEAHLTLARRNGAHLRIGSALRAWHSDAGGVRVTLEDGALLGADALVLCAGPWTAGLLPGLPLDVERQVVFWFAPAPGKGAAYPSTGPAFLWEVDPSRLSYGMPGAGGTVKAARHHGGRAEASLPAGAPAPVTDAEVRVVRNFLEWGLPGAAGPVGRAVVCRYTNTPTSRFIVAPLPGEPRVQLISACSGHGFKFASAIGEAVAQRILGRGEGDPLSSFGYPASA